MKEGFGSLARGAWPLLLVLSCLPVFESEGATPAPPAWDRVAAIFATNCGACHEWANKPQGIMAYVLPGKPDASPALVAVETGQMPPGGALSQEDRDALYDWIAAGAPLPPELGALPPASRPAAAPGALPSRPRPDVRAHMVSGFLAGGFLLAAGAVGTWHLVDLIKAGHDYRDSIGFPEEGASPGQLQLRSDYIAALWADPKDQALRWTHVGLLVAGGAFYSYNAVTGAEMLSARDPGISKRNLHRWGFFTHAGLMASEAFLGFFTTDALRRGDHDAVAALATAHAAVGVAAPLVILGSGLLYTVKL